MRRHLLACALVVMTSILAELIATPVAVCQMGDARGGTPTLVCTCGHGADAQCPMHHHRPAKSSTPSPANRWCAACQGGVDMIMTALVGLSAPVIARSEFMPPDGASIPVRPFGERPLDTVSPPLSPPPRS